MHLDPRMGAFDAVMFGVEGDPLLRSVIILVAMLDRAPDRTVIDARVDHMTGRIPRLRQRAVGNPLSPAPPRWEPDPNFDPAYHLRWRRGDDTRPAADAVLAYAERMSEADFENARPLWEAALLTDLAGGAAAFVLKIHHSITDGVGGMAMAADMFDLRREPGSFPPIPAVPAPAPLGMVGRFGQAAGFEARAARDSVTATAGFVLAASRTALTHPVRTVTSAATTTLAVFRMLEPQSTPRSDLMTNRSLSSSFSILEVSLDDLRRAADAVDTTINVCFVAAVAGAVRRYHEDLGHPLAEFRVNMPISLRTAADTEGGNRWVPARFIVPAEPDDLVERIRRLQPILRRARTDPALHLSTIVYQLLTLLPRQVTTSVAGSLMKGVDVAATNVPGPPIRVFTGGAEVTTLVPFAPKGGAAVNVALMSYAGRAYLGINCDPAAVTDPALLTDHLRAGLAEVAALR
ncbi:wax ester/triacylglycerol synthase domain-containing protein [Gordonia sp. NPDC003376]